MDAITSKKSRNSTLFTITQAGTISSRSGLYIRPSWKTTLLRHLQNRIKTYVVIFVILLSLSLRPVHFFNNNAKKNKDASKDDSDRAEDDDVISFSSEGYNSFSPLKEMKNIQDICSSIHTNANTDANANVNNVNANSNAGTSTSMDKREKDCSCLNPMEGKEGDYPGWRRAHEMNMKMVDESYTHNKGNWDVVFLGDSIIEEWNGRWLGREGPEWKEIHGVWNELFDPSVTSGGAAMKALALGIAGDHIANLLWRIQNGELERADSKVFWLLIGTNDLTASCSEEVILLGIIHIVEEIKKQKPDSIIVLNGILPRTDSQSGKLIPVENIGVASPSPAKTVQEQLLQDDEHHYDESPKGNTIDETDNSMNEEASPSITENDMEASLDANSASGTVSSTERKNTSPPLPTLSHRNFWQSIQSINKGLERYAEQNDGVEYFDASGIFVAHLGNKFYQLKEEFLMKELQGDFLHPTALGHKLWGEAIVDYIISDLDTPPNLRKEMPR